MYVIYHFNGEYHWIGVLYGYETPPGVNEPTATDVSWWLIPGTYEDDA